jgi:hypothetical protein
LYENIDSIFVIECLTHQTTHKTTARNYKRSKTGMPLSIGLMGRAHKTAYTYNTSFAGVSCGRDLQSQAAKKLIKASKSVSKKSSKN